MKLQEHLKIAEALAVILGVGIAVYEIYFGDWFSQRQALVEFDRRSFEIASGLLDGEAMEPFVELAVRFNNRRAEAAYESADATQRNDIESQIMILGFPVLFKIAEIDSCLENSLCNPEIVLDMTCAPILGVQRELEAITRRYSEVSQLRRERPLLRMEARCLDRVKRG